MNHSYFLLILLISNFGFSQNSENQNAIDYVTAKIQVVESLHETSYGDSEYYRSINYLENLTKIKPCYEYDFSGANKYTTIFILNDWKAWFELNRNNILLKKNSDAITFKNTIQLLEKNPRDEFLKHLEILKSNTLGEFKDLSNLHCSYDFFINLIGHDSTDHVYDEELGLVLPSDALFERIDNWYSTNERFLVWHKEEQQVVLKK